jgi:hypothetical protein
MRILRIWKITFAGVASYVRSAAEIGDALEGACTGEQYTVEVVEMSQEQFDALPDFAGF